MEGFSSILKVCIIGLFYRFSHFRIKSKIFDLFFRFNSYQLHPEVMLLYMLSHDRRDIRELAVQYILLDRDRNRQEVRYYKAPGMMKENGDVISNSETKLEGPGYFINWEAEEPYQLLHWDRCEALKFGYITEPSPTKHLTGTQLHAIVNGILDPFMKTNNELTEKQLKAVEDGIIEIKDFIPYVVCHSQSIERLVALVTLASKSVVPEDREGYIVTLVKSYEPTTAR